MTIYITDQRRRVNVARRIKYLSPAAKAPRNERWWETFEPQDRLLTDRSYRLVKRGFDLTLVLLALPVILPVILICALLIKLESADGPVIFTQQRTGKDGRRFGMIKFRTMVANAEELKAELSHLNELQWPDFKITDDPRVTRIGRFLRKSSLDELPQIFNVLRGDMSIVGPRPTSFQPETYRLWQTARLDVLPGLTGLWQIVGRGSMEFDERVALDIAYIERQSFALDLMILLRTVGAVLRREGAV
jgi:lipopolysaccharide/colanic/teichoic acid biosynthesis glycosyltransferase